jgi:uncharacterized protein
MTTKQKSVVGLDRGDLSLVILETGEPVVFSLELAVGYFSRLLGLQFRKSLPDGHGLLLSPCSGVHTCFLRFPIDVVMLDRQGTVLSVVRGLLPWRMAVGPKGTYAVLEVAAGFAGINPGKRLGLVVNRPSLQSTSHRLDFLRFEQPGTGAPLNEQGAT